MINLFAHVTPTEAPAGALLFLVGMAAGALVTIAVRRFSVS